MKSRVKTRQVREIWSQQLLKTNGIKWIINRVLLFVIVKGIGKGGGGVRSIYFGEGGS